MRTEVTALDWLEPIGPAIQPKKKPCTDVRRGGRVPARLQVAIGTENHAYLTKSVDISETGILIDNYNGTELSVGMRVRVLIKGVIADDDTDEQFTTMYVARLNDDQLALTFDEQLVAK